jgi:hypothetical protein
MVRAEELQTPQCSLFKNRKLRMGGGGQATEDQNRNLKKRVRFYQEPKA